MQTCKRCGGELSRDYINDDTGDWHIDCYYMKLGEGYGKEISEDQPSSPPMQKQRWGIRAREYLYGYLCPARSVAQAISKLHTREDR